MDKENVVYIQENIIQPQEEGSLATCHNMNDPEDTMLSEIIQRKTNILWSNFYVKLKKNLKLIETENRLVNARGVCVCMCVCVDGGGW